MTTYRISRRKQKTSAIYRGRMPYETKKEAQEVRDRYSALGMKYQFFIEKY